MTSKRSIPSDRVIPVTGIHYHNLRHRQRLKPYQGLLLH